MSQKDVLLWQEGQSGIHVATAAPVWRPSKGVALLIDEVCAGFRLNTAGSWEGLGVRPDLSAWSKAIANGHALSAGRCISKRQVAALSFSPRNAAMKSAASWDRVMMLFTVSVELIEPDVIDSVQSTP